MKTKMNVQMIMIALSMVFGVFAQEKKSSEKLDANEIFNSMMQTMPKEMKVQVDSASISQRSQKEQTEAVSRKNPVHVSKPEMDKMQEVDLNKLPEPVREQVRKTMQELEQQKEQRILEFKENKTQK
jgi:hypothetical protein